MISLLVAGIWLAGAATGVPQQIHAGAPATQAAEGTNNAAGEKREGPSPRRSSTPELSLGGSEVFVPVGEYHQGDLVSIGGRVVVQGDVNGDVVVIGGLLTVSGAVHGDVIVVGGVATISGTLDGGFVAVASRGSLGETAVVRGDCVSVAGSLVRDHGARIEGEFKSIDFLNFGRFASGRGALRFIAFIAFWLALVAMAIRFLGVLVVSAVAPARIEGALATPRPSWILAFLLGFTVRLFAIVLTIILFSLCVTIPIAVAFGLAMRVTMWMGLSSIYLEVGRRITRVFFGKELSYFASILSGFLIFALLGFIPLLGWLITWILSVTGLGLMLLTRFGAPRPAAAPASVPVSAPAPTPGVP